MQVNRVKLGRSMTILLPFICSCIFLLHCIATYNNKECMLYSFTGGTSTLIWIYFLINSRVYNLCSHHRMFIYYLIISNLIALLDTYYSIPISDLNFLLVFVIGFGVCLIICGVLKWLDNKSKNK